MLKVDMEILRPLAVSPNEDFVRQEPLVHVVVDDGCHKSPLPFGNRIDGRQSVYHTDAANNEGKQDYTGIMILVRDPAAIAILAADMDAIDEVHIHQCFRSNVAGEAEVSPDLADGRLFQSSRSATVADVSVMISGAVSLHTWEIFRTGKGIDNCPFEHDLRMAIL